MLCQVCGCPFRKIETSLICQNGHTLQNMTEVAHDDIAPAARTRRIKKKKKVKQYFRNSGCNLAKTILLKLLYEEARVFFAFPVDDIFRYFCCFFEFREGKLDSSLDVNKECILALIYATKRIEHERQGKPLFYDDFLKQYKEFDIQNRLALIKNRFTALEPVTWEMRHSSTKTTIHSLKRMMEILSNPFINTRPYSTTLDSGNGVYEEAVDIARFNFRRLFKNDLETMMPYFNKLCTYFNIVISDDLLFYFEKFILTFDKYIVIFPEYDIVIFLAIYLVNRNQFEGTETESKILNHFNCPKSTFLSVIQNKSKQLDNFISPEVYLGSLKKRNRKRFRRIKNAMLFIDCFKYKKAQQILKERGIDIVDENIPETGNEHRKNTLRRKYYNSLETTKLQCIETLDGISLRNITSKSVKEPIPENDELVKPKRKYVRKLDSDAKVTKLKKGSKKKLISDQPTNLILDDNAKVTKLKKGSKMKLISDQPTNLILDDNAKYIRKKSNKNNKT